MTRKRYAAPEALLRSVIAALESDNGQRHREAVLDLLWQGPLLCSDTRRKELEQPEIELLDAGPVRATSLVAAEMLAFLRTVVRLKDQDLFGHGLWLRSVRIFAAVAGGQVKFAAEGPMRNVALLQLLLLLQSVGLRAVRKCQALDCPRLFVKTYRREFCSKRCQKRTQARERRRQEREREARRARIRATARAASR